MVVRMSAFVPITFCARTMDKNIATLVGDGDTVEGAKEWKNLKLMKQNALTPSHFLSPAIMEIICLQKNVSVSSQEVEKSIMSPYHKLHTLHGYLFLKN